MGKKEGHPKHSGQRGANRDRDSEAKRERTQKRVRMLKRLGGKEKHAGWTSKNPSEPEGREREGGREKGKQGEEET